MINRRTALAGLTAAAATPVLAAPTRRQNAGSPVELPLKITRGLPWTTVALPDGRSFPFGLTTGQRKWGAHPSVTNPDYVPGKNSGGSQIERAVIGGKIEDTAIPCESVPGFFEGLPIAGLIGVIRYQPVLMDWDRQVLSINTRAVPAGYRKLRMDGLVGTFACIKLDIDGHTARVWVAPFIPWGLHLSTGWVKREGLWDKFARRRNDYDGEGNILHQSVIAERITVGGLTLDNAVVRLNAREDRYLRHLGGSNDGVIGFDLLKRLNMHVDRPQDALVFHVGYSGYRHDPYVDDRAGMAFTDYDGALTVTWIDETGPAFKAGVRRGDVVVAADVEAGVAGLPYALTRPAGTQVALDILRIQKRSRVVVTLEDRL
ncbi:hypothetical protein [Caulobacter sp. NIBR1757]|uniref:hypothetical protein n=1 Tax=Caulobacter sp. NIBR1757 TaxID=3016000 RepID=UPI0022F07319|nr:hypothetical protein [Caulobacter sp. NIBR1757]WGM40715.1 hypothetical protein AMEJIAPC_03662 [Caulobacter sp. NIBR1757]